MSDRIGSYIYNDTSPNYSINAPLEPIQFTAASAPGYETNATVCGLPSLQIFNGQGHDESTIANMGDTTNSADMSNSLGIMNPQHLGETEGTATTNGDQAASLVAHGDKLGLNNTGDLMAGGSTLINMAAIGHGNPMFSLVGLGLQGYGVYNQLSHHGTITPADKAMIGGSVASSIGTVLGLGGCIAPILKPVGPGLALAGGVVSGVGLAQRVGELEHHDKDK